MSISRESLLAVLILVSLSSVVLAHTSATGIVKERMDKFTRSKEHLKSMRSHIKKRKYNAIIPLAEEIRDWAEEMPNYFPSGSGGSPSEASSEIWKDFKGFEKSAREHKIAANRLILAAKDGNPDAVVKTFKSMVATCKSCHKSYRLD